MEIYPALRAHMGTTDYYIVRMHMREVASKIKVARDVYPNKTLDGALQRVLETSRARRQIAKFLERKDRFFGSIVVAAIGGRPTFSPVSIAGAETENAATIFSAGNVDESFGILAFHGGQKYYALDGQHRLAAIQSLIESDNLPEGFEDDQLSVIVLTNLSDKSTVAEKRKYRRIFSWLNRYAKKTSGEVDIIMEEDDTFAILTRRLISDHPFFSSPEGEAQIKSSRVFMDSKNIKVGAPHFTSLKTLYDMNKTLLCSAKKEQDSDNWGKELQALIGSRQSDDLLEKWHKELTEYWDAMLHVMPALKKPAAEMRSDDGNHADHMFFRPIGQEMMAKIARDLLDKAPNKPPKEAIAPMGKVNWNLRDYPWCGLVSYPGKKPGTWTMRNEERPRAMKLAEDFARQMLGIGNAKQAEMLSEWEHLYKPVTKGEKVGDIWQKKVKPQLNLK